MAGGGDASSFSTTLKTPVTTQAMFAVTSPDMMKTRGSACATLLLGLAMTAFPVCPLLLCGPRLLCQSDTHVAEQAAVILLTFEAKSLAEQCVDLDLS